MTISLAVLGYAVAVLAGIAAGVVINALADGITGDEEPPWSARACRACGVALPSARLPALGELRRRRVCVACGAATSLRRPLLELALGLGFALVLAHALGPQAGASARIPLWLVVGLDALALADLAFIFAVDLEHRLIFDVSVYGLAALLLGVALAFDRAALPSLVFGAVVCGGLFLLFYALGFVLYHQEALGFGDVKLAGLIGLLTGWPGSASALLLAAIGGAVVSVLLLGLGVASRRAYIPFGTFLALGAALVLLQARPVW